jgi:hypothetical protein
MKKITFLFLVLPVLIYFTCKAEADIWTDMFKKPQYFQGSQISFNATDISLGVAWASLPQVEDKSISIMYVQWTKFRDDAYWQDRNLSQLGDYAIGAGILVTLFGYEGLKPILGFKTYNLKSAEMQIGIAYNFHDKARDTITSFNLYYDPTVKRAVLSIFCLR